MNTIIVNAANDTNDNAVNAADFNHALRTRSLDHWFGRDHALTELAKSHVVDADDLTDADNDTLAAYLIMHRADIYGIDGIPAVSMVDASAP